MTRELTTKEAAEFIAKKSGYPISPITVRTLCRKGIIIARKHGTGWAINANEIQSFDRREDHKFLSIKTCGKCNIKTKDCNGHYFNIPGKSRKIFVCHECWGVPAQWVPSKSKG